MSAATEDFSLFSGIKRQLTWSHWAIQKAPVLARLSG
jgi:hypothetical protein